jgi:hypothetical protein
MWGEGPDFLKKGLGWVRGEGIVKEEKGAISTHRGPKRGPKSGPKRGVLDQDLTLFDGF